MTIQKNLTDKGHLKNLFQAEAAGINNAAFNNRIWQELASKGTFVFDVDDTLYRMDSGFHNGVKSRICADANATPDIRNKAKGWLGEDRDFLPQDLGTIFPLIVMEYNRKGDQFLEAYFEKVYGNDYTEITPDPRLVNAILQLEKSGKRIVLDTSGPSSSDPSKDMHVQKVLKRLGFDDAFVNRLRGNTYDLIMSVKDGAGKPTKECLDNFLKTLKVDPSDAVFFDDGVKNLETAVDAGMKGVWNWTTKTPPDIKDVTVADSLGVILVQNTGFAVDCIAKTLLNMKPAPQKPVPKIK
jgi:FMN phosphatase YigB (HAD superfamily)